MNIIIIGLALLLAGCSSVFHGRRYVYTYELTKPASPDMVYSDDNIRIKFFVDGTSVRYILKSVALKKLNVVRNEVCFVMDGFVEEALCREIPYSENDFLANPTATVPYPAGEYLVTPERRIINPGRILNEQPKRIPLFQNRDGYSSNLRKEIMDNKGKTFQLYLPIKVNGLTHDYLFEFTITDVVYKSVRDS